VRRAGGDNQDNGEDGASHPVDIGTGPECARPHRSFVVRFRYSQLQIPVRQLLVRTASSCVPERSAADGRALNSVAHARGVSMKPGLTAFTRMCRCFNRHSPDEPRNGPKSSTGPVCGEVMGVLRDDSSVPTVPSEVLNTDLARLLVIQTHSSSLDMSHPTIPVPTPEDGRNTGFSRSPPANVTRPLVARDAYGKIAARIPQFPTSRQRDREHMIDHMKVEKSRSVIGRM
jgi:hypothetical protein